MKKVFKNILLLILATLAIFIITDKKVIASTPDAYTICATPAEDSSVEMNIGWHTDVDKTNSYILYTTKDDTEWKNAIKIMGTYEYSDVFDGVYSKSPAGANIYEEAKFLNYNITLTNLTPDTEYMYKVGQDVLSDVHYFKTAGSNEFSFAWISDFHAYTPIPGRKNSAMNMLKTLYEYNNGYDFVFSTGDEIAWGGSYSFWKDLFKEEYHSNVMWASTIGNHDYMDRTYEKSSNDYFRTAYNLPKNGYEGEEGVCYYFVYSNVLFITMNNETQTTAEEVKKAQDWFEEVVKNNPTQYIIVSQHYQWFSGITGSFNNSTGYGRWKELFDKYNVDLAISGNNHIYVRSKPLYQDKVSTNPSLGTVYIQAPSSDNERGQAMDPLKYNADIIEKRFTEGGQTVGGIIVNVDETQIKLELLNRKGEVIDSTAIKARRDVHPMDGFDKEVFKNSAKYYQSNEAGKGVVTLSEKGIGYVKKVQILKDNQVISESNFKKYIDTNLTISGLVPNAINNLKVKITYKDETTDEVDLYAYTIVTEGELSNIKVDIENKKYKVTFDNTYDCLDEIELILNNQVVKCESTATAAYIDIDNPSLDDIITIVGKKEKAIVCYYNVSYYSSTDLNLDGISDDNDSLFLQKLIAEGYDGDIYRYDINNDGVLDIKDASYVSMFVNGKIDNAKEKEFKVSITDYNGKIIKVETVKANSKFNIEDYEYEGYTLLGFNEDYRNITRDIVIKPIVMK